MNNFIVMDRCEKMPLSCWGTYRKVAVVELDLACAIPLEDEPYREPKMISERARGVRKIVKEWRSLRYGTTSRSVYVRALAEAQCLADDLNAGRGVK